MATRKPTEKPDSKATQTVASKKEKSGSGKMSSLDAAVKVLTEAGTPMTTKAMIDVMAAKGYWTSPGGQTPAATLYSAVIREIAKKGGEARFVKVERGQFATNAGQPAIKQATKSKPEANAAEEKSTTD